MQLRIPGTYIVIDLGAKLLDEKRRGVDTRYHFNGKPLDLRPRRGFGIGDGLRR